MSKKSYKFDFGDLVVAVKEDETLKESILKISKIGKNDDGSFAYFAKRYITGDSYGDNEEVGPFTDEDLKAYEGDLS